MAAKLKLWLLSAAFWLYFASRANQAWSYAYRWLYERKRQRPVPVFRAWADLVAFTGRMVWSPDGPRELWDVFHSPGYIQWSVECSDGHAGDCGSFATWLVAAVNAAAPLGLLPPALGATILVVSWVSAGGKRGAHAVCLIADGTYTAPPSFCWMDYGYPSPQFATPRDAAADVVAAYAPGGRCAGWAALDGRTLAPLEVHGSL